MFGLYDIYKGNEKIGKAEVSREGLYYRFRCCCNLTGERMHRLTVTCGAKTENLGIPIPNGEEFWLSVRIPVSKFPQAEPIFRAVPKENTVWVPVFEDMPFPYISELSSGVLSEKEGEMGVLISNSIQQDSDQNP